MRPLAGKTRVEEPTTEFPFGRIKDRNELERGTPVNEEVYGDFHQFFEKLMSYAGLVANGFPESDYSGFQLMQALSDATNKMLSPGIIRALIGTYTTNDLIVLYGCTVSANIPGTSSITAGAIFYNDKIYNVPAATIPSPSGSLVYRIDMSDEPYKIVLVNAVANTGIANYNSSTVKPVLPLLITRLGLDEVALTSVSFQTGWAASTVGGQDSLKYEKKGKWVHLRGGVQRTTGGTNLIATIPSNFRPTSLLFRSKVCIDASSALVLKFVSIDTSGNLRIDSAANINTDDVLCIDFVYPID